MTRKDAKAATRQRLIDGAIALARDEGLGALTTGRIAAAAGLAQSSFYVHFSDRAACLRALGDAIGNQVLERISEARHRFYSTLNPNDLYEANRSFFSNIMEALLADRELMEVFLKCRREVGSPAGMGMRQIELKARNQVLEDLRRFGLDRAFGQDMHAYLDACVGALFGIAEGVVDGRIESVSRAIDMLAKMTYPPFEAALQSYMDQRARTATA